MRARLYDFEARILRETEKAVLVTDGDKEAWLPKRAAEISEPDMDGVVEITIPQDLAEEKGLV